VQEREERAFERHLKGVEGFTRSSKLYAQGRQLCYSGHARIQKDLNSTSELKLGKDPRPVSVGSGRLMSSINEGNSFTSM